MKRRTSCSSSILMKYSLVRKHSGRRALPGKVRTMATNMYSASGTVFQRNEFMKGQPDYERSWSFSEERYMASSREEAIEKVQREHQVHEDKYGLVEIRDLQIRDLGKLKTRGPISLQTGKPYNCTTLISVPARNIRSAEDEGFIPMRGARRCE